MLQRYTFYYIKYVLDKNIFIGLIYYKLNSYGLQTAKIRRADRILHTKFRTFSEKSAKNKKPPRWETWRSNKNNRKSTSYK
jgi:hypothetical protein